jgi:protein-tyrosine phosphatase
MKSVLLALIALLLAAPLGLAAEPTKIAFVDTGNTGRSVTAEALALAAVHDKGLPIAVVGRAVDLDPFDTAPETNAAAILKEHGIDVSSHRAAQITANDVKHADLILTMTARHKATVIALFPEAQAKTFTIAEYATGNPADVVDAYGKPMDVYQTVYAQIAGYMPVVLDKAVHR